MLKEGFVMVYRKLLDWEWYDDKNTLVVFIHLLLTVNYTPKQWHGRTIERGQRVVSRDVLAMETRLSVQNVRTAIKHLISTNEITVKSTKEFSLITLNNFDKYQPSTQQDNQAPTKLQPTANHNEIKLIKKESNNREKDIPNGISKETPKNFFGEYKNVRLTPDEHSRLIADLGDKGADAYIDRLSGYIASKGDKYKSHNATIRNWWYKDGKPVSRYPQKLPPAEEKDFFEKTAEELFG